jgi:hypothetical protein
MAALFVPVAGIVVSTDKTSAVMQAGHCGCERH